MTFRRRSIWPTASCSSREPPGGSNRTCNMEFKNGQRFAGKEELLGQPGYLEIEKQLFAWMREEIKQ